MSMSDPREATNVVKGFQYQFLHSLLAWLGLKAGETLVIEKGEDYLISSPGEKIYVQVKDKPNRVLTIATKDVQECIRNLMKYQHEDKRDSVSLRYATTSKLGKGRSGSNHQWNSLALWKEMRSNRAFNSEYVEKIKSDLVKNHEWSEEELNYIQESSPEEFYNSIIMHLIWDYDQPNHKELIAQIQSKLIEQGSIKSVTATDAKAVIPRLLKEVMNAASSRMDIDRSLSRADLLKLFDSETTITVPKSLFVKLADRFSSAGIDIAKVIEMLFVALLSLVIFMAAGLSPLGAILFIVVWSFYALYLHVYTILKGGLHTTDPWIKQKYRKLQISLRRGTKGGRILRYYLYVTMRELAKFFGDKSNLSRGWLASFIRVPVPLWTAGAFDRCLLLSLIYPLTAVILFWSISGDVGPTQRVLRLPSNLKPWQHFLQIFAFGVELYAVAKLVTTKSWVSAAWSVSGGAAAMTLAIAAAGVFDVAKIFASASIGAALVGTILVYIQKRHNIGFSSLQTQAVSGAAATIGVLSGTVIFSIVAEDMPIIGAMIGGCIALIVIGILTIMRESMHKYSLVVIFQMLSWLSASVLTLMAAASISHMNMWGKAGPMLLFLVWLPLINAPFDWFSVGLTRLLVQRGLERGGWWPIIYCLLDAAVAVLIVGALAICIVLANVVFNMWTHDQPVVVTPQVLSDLQTWGLGWRNWWLFALLFSALIPSTFNLVVSGFALVLGIPGVSGPLLREIKQLGDSDGIGVRWTSLAICAQLIGSIVGGVLLQLALVYVILSIVVPIVGINLLDICWAVYHATLVYQNGE